MEDVKFLDVPSDIRKEIELELNTLPSIHGKVILRVEFNCGSGRTIGSVKIHTSKEKEVRACVVK